MGRGRPAKLDQEKDRQLRALMRLKPTLKDTAAFLDLHTDTIERYIKKTYKMKYSEFRDKYMVHTRFNVVRSLIKSIESGNIKAIELGLSYFCGWQNKTSQENTGKIEVKYNIVQPSQDGKTA